MISESSEHKRVSGDHPIEHPDQDLLGRASLAQGFAGQLLSLDASRGAVVGVLGPWGCGKTSFVNLTRGFLKAQGLDVLDFNPWMFSGAEHLVQLFLLELAGQFKLRPTLRDIASGVEEYGEALSAFSRLPAVGHFIGCTLGVVQIQRKMSAKEIGGVLRRREKVKEALESLDQPLVVILDDIDRLSTSEIKDTFRLVRLTASFPNIIYLLAFDRVRVESALAGEGIQGRDYLEKILFLTLDLPAMPSETLQSEVLSSIDDALSGTGVTGISKEWTDIFLEIVWPLIRSIRDIRRYSASLRGTVQSLNGQVEVADVLALEAVRIFMPDVFGRIHGMTESLTEVSRQSEDAVFQMSINELLTVAGEREQIVSSLIRRLFPAAERFVGGAYYGSDFRHRWLRERRVAHEDVLRLYLERVVGNRLSTFFDAEKAWASMHDKMAFEAVLKGIGLDRLPNVIALLEAYEKEFSREHVLAGVPVLLNLLPVLPKRKRGVFDLGGDIAVGRVTYRLLRSLRDSDEVETAVELILPNLCSFMAKYELISQVGHREHIGHRLASEATAGRLERHWRSEVRSATAEELVRESDLLKVLLSAKSTLEWDEPPLIIPDTPEVTLALLRSAQSEVVSQHLGSSVVTRSPRLAWDALVMLLDSEEELKNRIAGLPESAFAHDHELQTLVTRYVEGWRPKDENDWG